MILDSPTLLKRKEETFVLETDLGVFKITDGVIVLEAKENVIISFKTGINTLLKLVQILGTKPVVHISHRINSYSIDPTDYCVLDKIPTLKGIAVVNADPQGIQSAKLERIFSKKPFRIFSNLEDAKKWADTVLQK